MAAGSELNALLLLEFGGVGGAEGVEVAVEVVEVFEDRLGPGRLELLGRNDGEGLGTRGFGGGRSFGGAGRLGLRVLEAGGGGALMQGLGEAGESVMEECIGGTLDIAEPAGGTD